MWPNAIQPRFYTAPVWRVAIGTTQNSDAADEIQVDACMAGCSLYRVNDPVVDEWPIGRQ
jgi:hypothetical protein